jgi:hypothetical protein
VVGELILASLGLLGGSATHRRARPPDLNREVEAAQGDHQVIAEASETDSEEAELEKPLSRFGFLKSGHR